MTTLIKSQILIPSHDAFMNAIRCRDNWLQTTVTYSEDYRVESLQEEVENIALLFDDQDLVCVPINYFTGSGVVVKSNQLSLGLFPLSTTISGSELGRIIRDLYLSVVYAHYLG